MNVTYFLFVLQCVCVCVWACVHACAYVCAHACVCCCCCFGLPVCLSWVLRKQSSRLVSRFLLFFLLNSYTINHYIIWLKFAEIICIHDFLSVFFLFCLFYFFLFFFFFVFVCFSCFLFPSYSYIFFSYPKVQWEHYNGMKMYPCSKSHHQHFSFTS